MGFSTRNFLAHSWRRQPVAGDLERTAVGRSPASHDSEPGTSSVPEPTVIGCNPIASDDAGNPHRHSKSALHVLLAMQKVVGSSPISRFGRCPLHERFLCVVRS